MSTVRGYLGGNLATATEIALFDEFGASRVIASDERLEIHSIHVTGAAAATFTVFADLDDGDDLDAGETLTTLALSTVVLVDGMNCTPAIYVPVGIKPFVIASDGTVHTITLLGVVRKVG